jgi:hypothetical protein
VPLVGIPAARLIGNTAGIAAAGLALLLLLLPRADAGGVDRVRSFARQTVSWVGPVWTVAVLATLWLQAAELSSNGIQASLGDIASYALNITSGRALLVAAIAAICYSFARPTIGLVLAIGGLIAVPLTGHAFQGDAPILTMAAIGLHVAAAALWVGSLGAIFLLASAWPELLAVVLPRFSTVAACCTAGRRPAAILHRGCLLHRFRRGQRRDRGRRASHHDHRTDQHRIARQPDRHRLRPARDREDNVLRRARRYRWLHQKTTATWYRAAPPGSAHRLGRRRAGDHDARPRPRPCADVNGTQQRRGYVDIAHIAC